jgi:hypothetical protein
MADVSRQYMDEPSHFSEEHTNSPTQQIDVA